MRAGRTLFPPGELYSRRIKRKRVLHRIVLKSIAEELTLKITLITVGKVKEKYFREAIDEYAKRISRYHRLDMVEVADEMTPDGAPAAVEERILRTEGERILHKIPAGSYVITLEIKGEMVDSVGLSRRMDSLALKGESHLCLIIGGSLGLAPEVSQRADWKLSFSPMTFPHQLMKVILLEQIYRACRISSGEPYHK